MLDLFADIDRWRATGHRVAIARVVDVLGSGPRLPGAAMAVNDQGEVAGSVSGGCVEGAVVGAALEVLGGERPAGMVSFGFSDDDAFAVGLTCGGTIRLFLEALPDEGPGFDLIDQVRRATAAEQPVAMVTVIDPTADRPAGAKLLVGPDGTVQGSLGNAELDRVVGRDAVAELEAARSGVRHYGPDGQITPEDLDTDAVGVFIESWAPPPQMIIFGAVDFTAALAKVAKVLGYRVTVCDARSTFATRRRFPMADEVIVSWPAALLDERGPTLGARDAVCILTHDPKFDVPAVQGALASKVGYIGVMGSRRTHDLRLARLAEVGVTDPADLARLMSPIGLDIGARTPEETAVSICAEIIGRRTGRTLPSLRDTTGSIH